MPAPTVTCTCVVCGASFTTLDRWRERKACSRKECRSEMGRRASLLRKGIKINEKPQRIAPPVRPYRTILQPAMDAYIAAMAAQAA